MTTTDTLRQLQADLPPAPWHACTAGVLSGNRWYVLDAEGEVIAHISANDGDNEEQRGPIARIAAAAPTHLADLITALEQIERVREVHVEADRPRVTFGPAITPICAHDGHEYPCPTIRILDGNE